MCPHSLLKNAMYATLLYSELCIWLHTYTHGCCAMYVARAQFHASDNQGNKDKLEGEMKTQLKKLQKMREQVRTWAGRSDVRLKAPLQEAREVCVERCWQRALE